jgi:hypothetical protein
MNPVRYSEGDHAISSFRLLTDRHDVTLLLSALALNATLRHDASKSTGMDLGEVKGHPRFGICSECECVPEAL